MAPFTSRAPDSVGHLGEIKLIRAIQRWLGTASPRAPFGIGDDCAVLPASRRAQLITVDPVIHGRHFDDRTPARAVGAKLLKRNLSDLAAMGGRPTAAVIALTLDANVSLKWLEGFYRGLALCARRYRVPVVGGDIAQANGVLVANLTLLGEAAGPRVITRRGARRGDRLYVTGVLGDSLRTGHHFKFTPRLVEGAWLAQHPAVRAMMDVSDGLAKDVQALTPSGLAAALTAEKLPRRPRASIAAALSDGEDYELLFVLSREADAEPFERAWRRRFPRTRLTQIGNFATVGKLPASAIDLRTFHGYEHLMSHEPPAKQSRPPEAADIAPSKISPRSRPDLRR